MTSPIPSDYEVTLNFDDYSTLFKNGQKTVKAKKVNPAPPLTQEMYGFVNEEPPDLLSQELYEKPKIVYVVVFYYKKKNQINPEYGTEAHVDKGYAKARYTSFVDYYQQNADVEYISVGLKFINFDLGSMTNVLDEEGNRYFFKAKREVKEKVYLNGPKKNLSKLGKHYANSNSK